MHIVAASAVQHSPKPALMCSHSRILVFLAIIANLPANTNRLVYGQGHTAVAGARGIWRRATHASLMRCSSSESMC